MKQKILHIVESFGGGVFSFLESLCNRLAQDFDVTIAYSIRPETPRDVAAHFDGAVRLIPLINGQRSIRFDSDLRYFLEIRELMNREKPDVVHLHSSKAGFVGRMAINPRRVRVVYTPHGYSMQKADDTPAMRSLYRTLERIAARKGTLTVGVSRAEYDSSLPLNRNSTYISNGIDLSYMPVAREPRSDLRDLKVGMVGRITASKGPALFNDIAQMLPDVSFTWIGDGNLRPVLSAPNIRITGWLNRQEGLDKLNELDVFLMPSLWEGLPIALLEAMYLQKICVASNIAEISSIIQHGENGYLAQTAEEFAAILHKIRDGSCDVNKIRRTAREDILREFNTTVMCEKYAQIYRGESEGTQCAHK